MERQESFLRLFLRHEDEIRAFTGSLVHDPHARQDVFQEIALTLWKEFDRYDPSRPFGAWARGVAANKCLQRRDQKARSPITLSPEAILAVSAAYERTERDAPASADALRHCLDRLPEKSRTLLTLRYERAMRLDRIAVEVHAGVDAVCQALSRLRTKLHECVTQWLAAREGGVR